MDEYRVMRQPFNIEVHKRTFINYLEVILLEDGTVVYAVPSHQEKLIQLSCKKLNVTRDELYDLCPREYYFDFMTWLCQVSGCVSLWNEHHLGSPNEKQQEMMDLLRKEKLYKG